MVHTHVPGEGICFDQTTLIGQIRQTEDTDYGTSFLWVLSLAGKITSLNSVAPAFMVCEVLKELYTFV